MPLQGIKIAGCRTGQAVLSWMRVNMMVVSKSSAKQAEERYCQLQTSLVSSPVDLVRSIYIIMHSTAGYVFVFQGYSAWTCSQCQVLIEHLCSRLAEWLKWASLGAMYLRLDSQKLYYHIHLSLTESFLGWSCSRGTQVKSQSNPRNVEQSE